MMPDPDPLDGTVEPWDHPYESGPNGVCVTCGWIGSYAHTAEFWTPRMVLTEVRPIFPSKAWTVAAFLGVFVTGLLLGAAVARVVGL